MRFKRIGCLASLGLLIGLPLFLNFTPSARHRSEVAAILQTRQQEFLLAQQQYGNDRERNTYLIAEGLPLWCNRVDAVKDGDGAGKETLRAFNMCNPLHLQMEAKELPNLLKDQKVSPGEFSKRRAALQPTLQNVSKACLRPSIFLNPASRFDIEMPEINLNGVRELAEAMSFEAELLFQEGRTDEAVRMLLATIKLGRDLITPPARLLQLTFGVSIEALGQKEFTQIIAQNHLSVEQLQLMAKSLEEWTPPKDSIKVSMEYEILWLHNSVALGTAHFLSTEKGPSGWGKAKSFLLDNSGLLQRELRIYDNVVGDGLAALGDLSPTLPPSTAGANNNDGLLWGELTGGKGVLSTILSPNYGRAVSMFRFDRGKYAILRTTLAVELYHYSTGHFPKDLTEISNLPPNEMSDRPFAWISSKDGGSLNAPVDKVWQTAVGKGYSFNYKDGAIQMPTSP